MPSDFARHPDERFRFILARELGMTVGELNVRMDEREFAQWQALYRLEAEEAERSEQRRRRAGGGRRG